MVNKSSTIIVVYFLIAGIFIADLLLPYSKGNISFLYLLPLILAVSFKEKNDVLLLGVVVTVLTVIAIFIKPKEDAFNTLLINRGAILFAIWVAVSLAMRIVQMRKEENEEDEELKALFEFATNGIIIVNSKGTIDRANPAGEQLFGYDPGKLIGVPIEKLIPQKYRKNHERYRNAYSHEPRPRTMGNGINLSGLKQDGTEFPVEISLSPFKSAKGAFFVAFVIDTTIRKQNEERILRQNQRLEQLAGDLQNLNENLEVRIRERTQDLEEAHNKLSDALSQERELGELKSRFVSMASHEFRTPLSTIQSSAGLINSYADRDDISNVKKHALKIKSAVNNLNTILTEFLSLGKLEEGETKVSLQKMNIRETVESTENELRAMFKTGQEFSYFHYGPEEVMLDPGLIKLTLLNLLSNAIKYTPENKNIRVETSVDHNELSLCVIDQGIGIPKEDQKYLFSRFFRATNASNIQGTGLGLYIVKRYVELMGGSLDLESEENVGTTVSAIFELQPEATESE
ncbi:MAG: PAS domain-containing sensor histidine kinase [Saprospiraceae bacterium]